MAKKKTKTKEDKTQLVVADDGRNGATTTVSLGRQMMAGLEKAGLSPQDPYKFLNQYTYGIPLHCLPLEYMLGVDVLPLGRMITLVGDESTTKTSLALYMARQFMAWGGLVGFVDAEHKFNESQAMAVMDSRGTLIDWDDPAFIPAKATDQEQMLATVENMLQMYSQMCPNKDRPFLLIVDSLKAGVSRSVSTAKDAGGEVAGFSDARAALAIQHSLQYSLRYLVGWPVLLAVINHQHVKLNESSFTGPGGPGTHESGGKTKEYLWSCKLEMRRLGDHATVHGKTPIIGIYGEKMALAEKRAKAVNVLYRSCRLRGADGVVRSHIRYDWDMALSFMLAEQVSKESIAGVASVTRKSDSRSAAAGQVGYSCPELDISNVHGTALGRAIHMDHAKCNELREVLGIDRRWKLVNGVMVSPEDYDRWIVDHPPRPETQNYFPLDYEAVAEWNAGKGALPPEWQARMAVDMLRGEPELPPDQEEEVVVDEVEVS